MAKEKNVTLTDLASSVAEKQNITKKQSEEILKDFIGLIKENVKVGNKVDIYQFGNFSKNERAARTGRNPQTGEAIQIKASSVPAFKASSAWKKELN